jgi:hypothetical protein
VTYKEKRFILAHNSGSWEVQEHTWATSVWLLVRACATLTHGTKWKSEWEHVEGAKYLSLNDQPLIHQERAHSREKGLAITDSLTFAPASSFLM